MTIRKHAHCYIIDAEKLLCMKLMRASIYRIICRRNTDSTHQIFGKFRRKSQTQPALSLLHLRLVLDLSFLRKFRANLVTIEKFWAAILQPIFPTKTPNEEKKL